MKKHGLTLLEIIVALVILSITMLGVANLFVAGKRHILHSRFRMAGGEIGKKFFAPLQNSVREDQWNPASVPPDYNAGNPLHLGARQDASQSPYTATYTVTNDGLPDRMRRVKIDITWDEPR